MVGKVLENKSDTFGYDAQTEEYVDMIEKGIIDPAKVVRTALQDAASVASLLITTEAGVAEAPKKGLPAAATATAAAWAEWVAWAAWTTWICSRAPGGSRNREPPPGAASHKTARPGKPGRVLCWGGADLDASGHAC